MAPVVSSLQLALNLHNFRYIFRRERDLAGEDYKQHVDERVSQNVGQSSEQGVPPVGQIEYRVFISQFECTLRWMPFATLVRQVASRTRQYPTTAKLLL